MTVEQNLHNITQEIEEACERVNRDPNEITIIGVTKYVTIEKAKEVINAGIGNIGENRMEGFLEKRHSIDLDVNWHFIGTLQSRKVKEVIQDIDFLHSLDRTSLAKEINKRTNKVVPSFVQVNVSGESSKHGLQVDEVEDFIQKMESYPNVKIIGLMTMAPHDEDEESLRSIFSRLRELRDSIKEKNLSHAPCEFLSMGMSNDYSIAIEEGATHIRIGTSLVGAKE
ncbi:YggS family pyridoxal phosphate-dependent enzyme [Saliterribacillus persicus]|uniref:Pyridoxal phosphate homeostasis protein n=1 Tax=Saliterribacillus persicus TaxID=930114 RepID=A0A368XTH0_9BACI|nr:YggS family pyridoxal phosphate-dependent enzyme [Saliterribacillus persicus]RCW70789.1 hypothetical protein DFR57_106189 [Saliterribacillus persicus]